MVTWLQTNAGWLGIIVGVVGVVVPLVSLACTAGRYVSARREELRQRRYENYHDLIHRLVAPGDKGRQPRLDSQIAVAFELGNYREYRELSVRLLQALADQWGKETESDRLVKELNLTLAHLRQRWPRR